MVHHIQTIKCNSLATSRNPSPKHRSNKNHKSNNITQHKKNLQTNKYYALESQITKSDFGFTQLGHYIP
jgi:hypothetical protein